LQRHVDRGRRALDHDLRVHHRERHGFAGKPEIDAAALCLRAPQVFSRHFDVAKSITFYSEFCHCSSPNDFN